MVTAVILGVVVLAAIGILQFVRAGDRHSTMTEKEFQEEAERGSALGGAFLEIQRIVSGGKNVEYMLQRDKRPEGDSAESGDQPDPGKS